MIETILATISDIKKIQSIAYKTWPITFGEILSSEQIDYMLEMMYSEVSLKEQMEHKGHVFYLAKEKDDCLGYVSYEIDYNNKKKTKIHKIYVLPEAQGKGVGKILLNKVTEEALRNKQSVLSLNVNRFNNAVAFYEKTGFKIIETENIPIGNGFLMEDYIMEKEI